MVYQCNLGTFKLCLGHSLRSLQIFNQLLLFPFTCKLYHILIYNPPHFHPLKPAYHHSRALLSWKCPIFFPPFWISFSALAWISCGLHWGCNLAKSLHVLRGLHTPPTVLTSCGTLNSHEYHENDNDDENKLATAPTSHPFLPPPLKFGDDSTHTEPSFLVGW